jgi:soluble lytic murein transglycosylase-like protein
MHLHYRRLSSLKLRLLIRVASAALVFFSILSLYGAASAPVVQADMIKTDARMLHKASADGGIKAPKDMPSSGNDDIDQLILNACSKYGVDPKLVYYVIRQESNFKVSARSGKNAQGLMQMIPATAQRFGVENVNDPQQNIEGGVKYLRWLLKEFKGNIKLALAGYNAGEGAVKKCGNQVPEYKETKDYVEKITAGYGKTFHPVLEPEQARVEFGEATAE